MADHGHHDLSRSLSCRYSVLHVGGRHLHRASEFPLARSLRDVLGRTWFWRSVSGTSGVVDIPSARRSVVWPMVESTQDEAGAMRGLKVETRANQAAQGTAPKVAEPGR